jgi:hypothetical protein
MIKQFWHNLITDKSFEELQNLRREVNFVLIGGWAIYFYTHQLKSKDIDIIVDMENLNRLKQKYNVYKNERLCKYEIKKENVDIDIYIPYWSNLGLKVESIMENTVSVEGFILPLKEILLILKLFAYSQRKNSLKGAKDIIDIISLLYYTEIDFVLFKNCIKDYNLLQLEKELREILNSQFSVEELDINQKQYKDFKKRILAQLDISS